MEPSLHRDNVANLEQSKRLNHPLSEPPYHVVIVGGGFAGLHAAKALGDAPVRVTLIDRRNFHLFQPLLYQVATGGLSPGDITAPLRAVLRDYKNISVLLAEVTDIDAPTRRVVMDIGWMEYDSLIVATGANHSYFGNDAWRQYAPGLKTVEDATEIRRRLLNAFEMAEREPDPEIRRQWLTFVVVGGGPTGVELAGALGEIANETLRRDFRVIRPEESQILLLDASPRILGTYDPELSLKAERSLVKLGVRTRAGVRVIAIDDTGVILQSPAGTERIASRTVLWAAGVQGSPLGKILASSAGAQIDRSGRVQVEPSLTVPGHPEILVIGDLAALQQDGQPVPGVAPAAMQMGDYAARQVIRRLRAQPPEAPFRYRDKGSMAVIGRASAVANIFGWKIGGYPAWLVWLFIHLMYLVGFRNRLLVFIQWGFQYLTFNRGARIISPESRSAGVTLPDAAGRAAGFGRPSSGPARP